jgi:hypothetical protein
MSRFEPLRSPLPSVSAPHQRTSNRWGIDVRLIRRLLTLIGALSVAFALLALGYSMLYSMDSARPFEAGKRGNGPSVLIATQGSAYKDAVSRGVVSRLSARPAHLKVIDVSALPPVFEREWDALVLMSSWERWQPEPHTRNFIERCAEREKLVVLTTSGAGDARLPCIDAVTSASELDRADTDAAELARRVEAILSRSAAPSAP